MVAATNICCYGMFLAIISNIFGASFAFPPEYDHGVSLPTTRPLVVAHRGASGILPEHTVEAYQLAIEQGADIIECDLSVSKDLQLLCLHESWMNETTDVEEKFPEKNATYFVQDQGREITDYFTVDFTLAELKNLRINQRFWSRDPSKDGMYSIATLEEYIQVAQNASRPIGIYPETKEPEWVNSLDIIKNANTSFERLLIDVLESYGYTKPTDPCFVQSFSFDSLLTLKNMTDLPLIRLMRSQIYYSDEDLKEAAEICYGIGPSKTHIFKVSDETNWITETTNLTQTAHNLGLRIHPYTFRNEHEYLAFDYGLDPYEELEKFLELEIDGYFTDFPATVVWYLNATYIESNNNGDNSAVASTPFLSTYICMLLSCLCFARYY